MALILHHFDTSPFAEKVRLTLGLKGLAWHSVSAEITMPKPKLTALTGGYRKTPVLQIGADVYCDSRLIVAELERRHPEPTLFPDDSRSLCQALAPWSDGPLHIATSGLTIAACRAALPPALLADRQRYFQGFLDVSALDAAAVPHLAAQLRAHAARIDAHLAADDVGSGGGGGAFWLGPRPSLADWHAYVGLWTVRAFVPALADPLLRPFGHLPPWEARVAAIGHGPSVVDMTPEAAIAVARDSEPASPSPNAVDPDDPLGLQPGDLVVVTPDDYGKEPVVGHLVALTLDEVAVQRTTDAAGRVVVHFPRIGFRIDKVPSTAAVGGFSAG